LLDSFAQIFKLASDNNGLTETYFHRLRPL
jgi:hypothetical protein